VLVVYSVTENMSTKKLKRMIAIYHTANQIVYNLKSIKKIKISMLINRRQTR